MQNHRLQEADRAAEVAKSTFMVCARVVQQHAADLQQWLDRQEADLTQPEEALDPAGEATDPSIPIVRTSITPLDYGMRLSPKGMSNATDFGEIHALKMN